MLEDQRTHGRELARSRHRFVKLTMPSGAIRDRVGIRSSALRCFALVIAICPSWPTMLAWLENDLSEGARGLVLGVAH